MTTKDMAEDERENKHHDLKKYPDASGLLLLRRCAARIVGGRDYRFRHNWTPKLFARKPNLSETNQLFDHEMCTTGDWLWTEPQFRPHYSGVLVTLVCLFLNSWLLMAILSLDFVCVILYCFGFRFLALCFCVCVFVFVWLLCYAFNDGVNYILYLFFFELFLLKFSFERLLQSILSFGENWNWWKFSLVFVNF